MLITYHLWMAARSSPPMAAHFPTKENKANVRTTTHGGMPLNRGLPTVGAHGNPFGFRGLSAGILGSAGVAK